MSTIKIDRGFTQKIQQKGAVHTPTSQKPLTPPPKKPQGWPKWMAFAAGGAGLVAVIVIGSLVSKGAKKPAAAARTAPPAAAVQPALPAAAKAPEALEPVEPAETQELYAKAPAIAAAPQPAKPAPYQPHPVKRDVAIGSPQGLLCEYYEHINGSQVGNLRSASTFPGQPSKTVQIGRFELSEGVGENYGVRVRGYLVPPKSGAYTFVVNVDDGGELWLSTDDQPANIRKLVALTTGTRKKWSERPEQRSAPCELVGGKRYYLEALMKQSSGGDYLAVGWLGLEPDKILIIEAPFLIPWTDAPAPDQAAPPAASADRRKSREAREAALAPAKAAVAEQQRGNGAAYRFAQAAQALKDGKSAWRDPEALALVETAILRFELLGRLRAFVQTELARARVPGVWVAFGGQADVTGASDEGVTVAPGRIVAWSKVPPDQMLRLANAVLTKATVDTNTKGSLFLAAAVFCKEANGGIELALKYRERAVSLNSTLTPLAERVLGGTPEAILAQPRIQASRAELGRVAAAVAGLAEKTFKLQSDFASVTGLVAGLNVEYWDSVAVSSLDDLRKKGVTTKTAPSSVELIQDFETPSDRGDKYVARARGYLVPSETGEYCFYIAADDQGEFWLSPDENPDKAVICIKADTPGGKRQWDKDKRKSKPVSLVKGQRYYVKGLMREGEKGDHFAVAWSLAADNKPQLITSANLACAPAGMLPPGAELIRKKIEDDLQSVQTLVKELLKLREAEEAEADAQRPATTALANELQKQVEGSKEALRDAENILRRIGGAVPQLKAALQPESPKPQ